MNLFFQATNFSLYLSLLFSLSPFIHDFRLFFLPKFDDLLAFVAFLCTARSLNKFLYNFSGEIFLAIPLLLEKTVWKWTTFRIILRQFHFSPQNMKTVRRITKRKRKDWAIFQCLVPRARVIQSVNMAAARKQIWCDVCGVTLPSGKRDLSWNARNPSLSCNATWILRWNIGIIPTNLGNRAYFLLWMHFETWSIPDVICT